MVSFRKGWIYTDKCIIIFHLMQHFSLKYLHKKWSDKCFQLICSTTTRSTTPSPEKQTCFSCAFVLTSYQFNQNIPLNGLLKRWTFPFTSCISNNSSVLTKAAQRMTKRSLTASLYECQSLESEMYVPYSVMISVWSDSITMEHNITMKK